MQLLRKDEVCQRLKISEPTLYRRVRDGDVPAPLRIGPRCSRWRADEIDEFVESRPRSTEVAAR